MTCDFHPIQCSLVLELQEWTLLTLCVFASNCHQAVPSAALLLVRALALEPLSFSPMALTPPNPSPPKTALWPFKQLKFYLIHLLSLFSDMICRSFGVIRCCPGWDWDSGFGGGCWAEEGRKSARPSGFSHS